MANESLDRALDWDDVIQNDSPDFVLLPEGTYPFTVRSFERGEYTPGPNAKLPACKKAILTIDIDGGALGTVTVKHNLFLHSRTEGLLCAFFTSIGQRKHGEQLHMNWQTVPGSRGLCKVIVTDQKSNDGRVRQFNNIERFLEPDDTAPAAPAQKWSAGNF